MVVKPLAPHYDIVSAIDYQERFIAKGAVLDRKVGADGDVDRLGSFSVKASHNTWCNIDSLDFQ